MTYTKCSSDEHFAARNPSPCNTNTYNTATDHSQCMENAKTCTKHEDIMHRIQLNSICDIKSIHATSHPQGVMHKLK